MNWKTKGLLAVLILTLLPFLLTEPRWASAQFTPPPDPGGGSGGGSCSYCDQDACGCQPHERCVTYASCGCSSIQCTRSCSYDCF
jgi:hypothetical protein